MKKTATIFSLFLLLGTIFSASAQQNESWRDRSPYEVTIGTNLAPDISPMMNTRLAARIVIL
ncbi:MAG: hypothetical protein SNH73_06780 [Rikenellaceae bacterium]